MKRKDFRRQPVSFPEPFVRLFTGGKVLRASSVRQEPRGRAKRIFVIKQRGRLTSASGGGKEIRRILIFDNHPESLRLVFGRRANPHVDPSAPARVSRWELIFVSILTMAALAGMFWPLF
jgi:hypothetical protein